MNKPLLYSVMTLFFLVLLACGKKGVDSNIQRYLNTHYRELRLTVVETAKLPYNNYHFWATDKQGITIKGVWHTSNKETNDIHALYEEALRRHSITDYIKQELSGAIQADVYTGNTEQEFCIYCMEILTAENKYFLVNKLRLALDKAAAAYNLTHYQASLRFTWQGTPREGMPTVRETPTNYYNTWLFALLEGPGSEEVPYFHLAGTYANHILVEQLNQKAIEINNTIYSAPVFFQVEQTNLSEIFASFSIRSDKPEERSQLFLVYEPLTETVKEYNVVTLPLPDNNEAEDATAGFADYIPDRFRYQETLMKHSGLFREVY